MAVILDGLISNPCFKIIKSKNFPACTPKVHFSRFNFNPNICAVWKVSLRSCTIYKEDFILTRVSSM